MGLCPWSARCSFSRRSESRREGSSRAQRSSACQNHQHNTYWQQQSQAIDITFRRQATADQGFSPRRDDRRLGCVRETSLTVSPTCCFVPCSCPLIYLSSVDTNTTTASTDGDMAAEHHQHQPRRSRAAAMGITSSARTGSGELQNPYGDPLSGSRGGCCYHKT